AAGTRDIHARRIRQMGPRGSRARHQGEAVDRNQPGRYSPVFGSGFNFGMVVRSCGAALARISSSSALTRRTSLTHQRAKTVAPITPRAKTTSGGIVSLSPDRTVPDPDSNG